MEQAPTSDISSSHRPATFHGFDSEDINRWLDKVENYLKLRPEQLKARRDRAARLTGQLDVKKEK